MSWGLLVGMALIAACGRFGFDQSEPEPPDVTPDAPGVVPTGFVCNEQQRFAGNGAPVAAMAAVPTADGHALFMADTAGNLVAWTYEIAGDALKPTAANLAIDTDITSTLSATSVGSSIMLGAVTGLVAPAGTKLYPRDELGAARGPAMTYSEFAADGALATSPGGKVVFANVDVTSKELHVRRLEPLGAFTAAPAVVAPASDNANYATIGPAGPGYVVQWNVTTGAADPLMVAVIDESLAIVAGPVQVNTNGTGQGPGRPRVIWAKTSSTYIVTWHEKNAVDDDVWYQLRDANLDPITVPAILGPSGIRSEVSTDGTGFWVTWKNLRTGVLDAARISPSGVLTPRVVPTSGGVPSQWTMLANRDQPVLVWVETGGSGLDVWIDPLCP